MRQARIGEVEIDFDSGRVLGPDGRVGELRRQSAEVLRVLVRQRGDVVSKAELFEAVWGSAAVTDDCLVQCIGDIRRALGSARDAVQTLPCRGYRLAEAAAPAEDPPAPIRFVRAHDGVRIAWTDTGAGVPVLKAPNWISHLGHEQTSRLYAPFYRRLGQSARIVRQDQRGNGLSDWDVPPLTLDDMVADLDSVRKAAGLDRFVLFGLSQGAAYGIEYAVRHPERVLGIVAIGGRGIGSLALGTPAGRRAFEAGLAVIRGGWGDPDPSFRRYFTARILPDASPEVAREYDELQRLSLPLENIEAYFTFGARLDVREAASRVRVPVLMLHSRGDRMVPPDVGRELAACIPSARFVEIAGNNHIPIPETTGFAQAAAAFDVFLGEAAQAK